MATAMEAVMHSYEAVDEFLMARSGLRLEEVLCDGCFIGRLSVLLGERARIMPRLVRSTVESDGGLANLYEGILVLDDVWYRFACQVFVDPGGQRFLADVSSFEAIEWQARVAVPA
jgi:hypothetical protein